MHKLIPATEKGLFMDTAEAYANKGYESIYDVDCKRARDEGKTEGYDQACSEFTATIANLQAESKAKDKDLASKEATIADKDATISAMATENAAMAAEKARLKAELAAAKQH